MNRVNDAKQLAALDAAKRRRATARASLESNLAAKALAEQAAADATATLQRVESQSLEKADRDAAALVAQMMAGGRTIEVTVDEQIMLAKVSAESRQKLCADALAKLEGMHAKAEQELQIADAAVRVAAVQLLICEGEKIAAQIEDHEAQAMALRENLLGLRGDEIHRRKDNLFTSAAIEQALGLSMEYSARPRFCDVVLHNGSHRDRVVAADGRWQERLAALIQGDAIPRSVDSMAA